ncbi:glycosyltransferase [Thalassobellus sediminis]|uniref:glycosyltransferase n=1 Tax=Thalassobellus sediminis TaxID=3367753 RepID=UPI0037910578
MSFTKGITVLISTYNGAKNLPETLRHLAIQEIDNNIPWEIILIDNASTDNSLQVALKTWNKLNNSTAFITNNEPKKGKENAIDKGLEIANYQYVVICDDDNWLEKSYLQLAYEIMSKNEDIGMLGGQGIPAKHLDLPDWFSGMKTYYAVGQQSLISGEIKHYHPKSRFIWGAGSVINMKAYCLLKKCRFERVLTNESEGKIARSEDLELSLAIWLTGHKLWYDRRLIYEHALSQDRLTWNALIHIIKISAPAYHVIRPYDIFIFTGKENAPKKSYWIDYIIFSFKNFKKHFNSPKDIITIFSIIFGNHKQTTNYALQVRVFYQFLGMVKLWKKYNHNFKKIKHLQIRLSETVENYDQKLLNCQ